MCPIGHRGHKPPPTFFSINGHLARFFVPIPTHTDRFLHHTTDSYTYRLIPTAYYTLLLILTGSYRFRLILTALGYFKSLEAIELTPYKYSAFVAWWICNLLILGSPIRRLRCAVLHLG